jgi:hypothetical protein
MNELEAATVIEGEERAATVADAAKKSKARGAPKWETEARDRLKTAIRRYSKPLADLVARDANEGDTRLLVTDFLCDGLGFDKYADLTTEYQVKGEFADYGLRIDRELVAFIEVKRVATKLSTRHLRQVEMYAVNEGVEWIILTNGSTWCPGSSADVVSGTGSYVGSRASKGSLQGTTSIRGLESILEPIAGPVNGDDLAVVQQPVQDGRGQHVVAEHAAPLAEGLVAGQQDGAALIAASHQLEDHVGIGAGQREVADLIDDQRGGLEVGLELLGESPRRLGFLEVADQVVQGGEVDRVAGLAGGDGQADGEHGLADPGWAEEADIRLVLDEAEGGEVADLAGVQVGLEGEVELIEALVVGQARQLQGVGEPPALPHADLFLQQQVDELQISHGGLLGPGDQRVQVLTQVGEPQPLGMLTDAGGDQLAHDRTPASWS